MKIKQAFTLAEVLVTLSIIGIIAAITIPSLIINVDLDRKQAETIIKKTYTTFNDATKQIVMLETTSHNMGSVGCADANCIRDLYGKYVSYLKTCNSDAQATCLDGAEATSQDLKTSMLLEPAFAADPSSGQDATPVDFSSKSLAVLADGTLVGFKYDSTCKMTTKSIIEYEGTPVDVTKSCVSIAVDTNGAKSPNMIGKDRYQFAIGKLGVKFKAQNVSTTP